LSDDVLVVNDVQRLKPEAEDWMLAAARAVKAKLVLVDETGFYDDRGEDSA